ncbi:hypothetical protein AAFG13_38355 [Bradyrhizobium sp. B124]
MATPADQQQDRRLADSLFTDQPAMPEFSFRPGQVAISSGF